MLRRPADRAIVLQACVTLAVAGASAAYARPARADGGVVTGTVTVLEKRMLRGLVENEEPSGVLVYLTGFEQASPGPAPTLGQRERRFDRELLPVVVGETVAFPNHDTIYHNVFSVSPVQSFDLGQYKGSDATKRVTFQRPGLVPVYCNIHPEMISYIVVLENRAFGVTDEHGRFEIRDVPEGEWTLHAWTPRAERVTASVAVRSGGTHEVALEVRETMRIRPHRRKDGSRYPEPDADDEIY